MSNSDYQFDEYIRDACYPRILCSARCKHNSGEGYYNLCQHSRTENPNPYGGVTRAYVSSCELFEKPDTAHD